MIPAYCIDTAPPGEKAAFAALRDARDTDHWTVLHSLGIAKHDRQVEGEADFVVIAPGLGLLVLEVKSHQSVERSADGTWRLGHDAATTRGPFQQAQEAMHSIRKYLVRKQVGLRDVPVLHAVWFTGVRARTMLPKSPEWHDWQVLDSQDLHFAGPAVRRTLSAGAEHLAKTIKHFGSGGLGPDERVANQIANLLRPRFEIVSTPGDRRRAREGQLAQFVEEQYRALDAAADNRSALFVGAAGTGKTFLAVEAAQREIAQGRSGRLLCFNRLLAQSLRDRMSGAPRLRVNTIHGEMLRLAGLHGAPNGAGREFWEGELTERALDGLANRGADEVGDFLIVDEVQDIAVDAYLDLLDLMVVGGFRNGRVLLFGDFERQALYDNADGRLRLQSRAPSLPSFRLLENCRNLPRIGYHANLLAHLSPGFKAFRRPDDGIDPVVIRYSDDEDQPALLKKAIIELREEGFALSEIVVLSPRCGGSVSARNTDPWLRHVLRPADGASPRRGRASYSTIHAFKGLDAPAVIVTDLDDSRALNFDSLLYVALTRATDRLTTLVETNTLRRLLGG